MSDSRFQAECHGARESGAQRPGCEDGRLCLKIGPGEAFLITIADRFRKPVHTGLGATNTALPQLDDPPAQA